MEVFHFCKGCKEGCTILHEYQVYSVFVLLTTISFQTSLDEQIVFLNSRKKDWRTWVSLNDNTKVQFKGNKYYTNKWKLVWWNKTVSDENILLLPFKNT